MKSKLSTQYPQADPAQWLVFSHNWQTGIDPIFAGRLAALYRDKGKKGVILSGYRSYEEQVRSYKSTGGYQDSNGNWVGGSGYAARPGNSPHEYRLAIDTSDMWLKALEKDLATSRQTTLLKYGLYKPLTRGNGYSVLEDWHIEPIETWSGRCVARFIQLMPEVTGNMDVREFQKVMGLAADGVVGPKTIAKAQEVKGSIEKILKSSASSPVKTGDEALKWLVDNKVIDTPDYWRKKMKEVQYFDLLLVKIVNEFKG